MGQRGGRWWRAAGCSGVQQGRRAVGGPRVAGGVRASGRAGGRAVGRWAAAADGKWWCIVDSERRPPRQAGRRRAAGGPAGGGRRAVERGRWSRGWGGGRRRAGGKVAGGKAAGGWQAGGEDDPNEFGGTGCGDPIGSEAEACSAHHGDGHRIGDQQCVRQHALTLGGSVLSNANWYEHERWRRGPATRSRSVQ